MIKEGNYHFFDFAKHREKFEDIFADYYGREHLDTIKERMDSVVYVPYMNFDHVNSYFNHRLDLFRDEILEEYSRLSGRAELTDAQKDMIWNNGGSVFTGLCINGDNLMDSDHLGDEKIERINDRLLVAKEFGVTDENPYEFLAEQARYVFKAIEKVCKEHPCDAFTDMMRAIKLRNIALQMYLTYVNKHFLCVTDRDYDIINKPDFDSQDKENLDCFHILFEGSIEHQGLVQYFTSESEERTNKSVQDRIEVYEGRVQMLALCGGIENLEHVTIDELFGEVDYTEEYGNRLAKELVHLGQKFPEYYIMPSVADKIENVRQGYLLSLYAGCKFAQNLNKTYNTMTHEVHDDTRYVTYLEFLNDELGHDPINVMFFDESQCIDPERLLSNLIHELNHILGRGLDRLDNNGKKVASNTGMIQFVRKVEDGEVGDYYRNNKAILNNEENWNEQMTQEILKMFVDKYGLVIGVDDVETPNLEGWQCVYDYYSFMSQPFWEKYKDKLKNERLKDIPSYFYDLGRREAISKYERFRDSIGYKVKKIVTPERIKNKGFLNHRIIEKLGKLIEEFQSSGHITRLINLRISPESLIGVKDFSTIENMPEDLAITLSAYKTVADSLMKEMQEDEQKLTRAVAKKEAITKLPSKITTVFKTKAGESIDSIKDYFKTHKRANVSQKRKPENLQIKNDTTICPKCNKPKRTKGIINISSTVDQLLNFAKRRNERNVQSQDDEKTLGE